MNLFLANGITAQGRLPLEIWLKRTEKSTETNSVNSL